MTLLEVVVLAIVQGVAEFLPISSSGHLVVVSEIMGHGASAELNVVLHAGTLLSIVIFFRRRILSLLREDRRVNGLLLVATLPAAVAGLIIKYRYRGLLESPLLSGFMLIVTGLLLLGTLRLPAGDEGYQDLTPAKSLLIGAFQALALLPGISRSGATIFGGLVAGLNRQAAATFSFLLATPVIAGASMLEVRDLMVEGNGSIPGSHLVIGCAVAFLVGLASLAWLFRWIERGKLHYFAYWCIPLGVGVVIWQLFG